MELIGESAAAYERMAKQDSDSLAKSGLCVPDVYVEQGSARLESGEVVLGSFILLQGFLHGIS